ILISEHFFPPPLFRPPATRVSDKVMIPQDEYPEINFVGLLIGPRGNTLKNIEKECCAKIMIRGKGSVKEGKVGRKDGQMLPGEDEPLHALVTANTMENVKKAVEQVSRRPREKWSTRGFFEGPFFPSNMVLDSQHSETRNRDAGGSKRPPEDAAKRASQAQRDSQGRRQQGETHPPRRQRSEEGCHGGGSAVAVHFLLFASAGSCVRGRTPNHEASPTPPSAQSAVAPGTSHRTANTPGKGDPPPPPKFTTVWCSSNLQVRLGLLK
ncbi:unnamed protein product, partial [Tetraodon nigroviridis]